MKTVLALLPVVIFLDVGSALDINLGFTTRFDPPFSGAAISMALDRARADGLIDNHNFSIVYRIPGRRPEIAMDAAVELIQKEKADVVLGHKSSSVCIPTGYYYQSFNIAMLPTGCVDPTMSNKEAYNTLIRCTPSSDKIGNAVVQMFETYGWKRAVFFTRESGRCDLSIRGISAAFEVNNITVGEWIKHGNTVTDEDILNGLKRLRERGRVIIVCHLWDVMQRFMYAADDVGMTGPEYTFIFYELLPVFNNAYPWLSQGDDANYTVEEMEKKIRIFNSFKQVTLADLSMDYQMAFFEELLEQFKKPPWEMTYDGNMDPYTMFLADCSYLYLMLVNETLAAGEDYRDGRLLFSKARNRQFMGWTGRVLMDDKADREPDFWLWHCKPGASKCNPYSYLKMAPPPTRLDNYEEPYWPTPDRKPPPDTPECGFKGELCPENDNTVLNIVGGVAAVIIIIIIGLAVFFIRRQKLREKELQMMTWKIIYSDIEFSKAAMGSVARSMRSIRSVKSSDSRDDASYALDQLYTKVGIYNGTVIAVKFVDKPAIHLTRDVLVELKLMKDIIHENVNTFIGACIDPPNICVVSAYCAKGSLQDIIENTDIKLDWLFKSSLMMDLVNGMCYLQSSEFKSHGALKSSNCLIDSRWVLKISGFGLCNFKEGVSTKNISEYKKYEKLLWTAPELVKLPENERPLNGTQKGDVYSFGIILQETLFRAPPFFEDMEPRDIVNRVINGEAVPYRPAAVDTTGLDDINPEILSLMVRCWDEDPHVRPAFSSIKVVLKALNKGRRTNIMDNMISMLEKYATNLEGLVNQRTSELVDEKKKTDRLLYSMLPPTVADKLKKGETMEPEMFEAVTIYFSDIVGFTSIASESTPMQVVDLLNDLYTAFDRTIEKYDVYKVETIGDAYMVVSGLPRRNGDKHAQEIADMALSLLDEVKTFQIRHRPGIILQLRIGLHSGPCAAGVVGMTMPRYCLFGDTVNMASRMESTGEAKKIHISESAKVALDPFPKYCAAPRGQTEVKGKGLQNTYWLYLKQQCTDLFDPQTD